MKTVMKKMVAFMLSAMMLTVTAGINSMAASYSKDNGTLTWNLNGVDVMKSTEVSYEGLTICSAGSDSNGGILIKKSSGYIAYTPTVSGTLTVIATIVKSGNYYPQIYVDTMKDDNVNCIIMGSSTNYGESVEGEIILEKGVTYYVSNSSSSESRVKEMTFTPDTTGSTVWDLTNVNNRLANYSTFTADDLYEYSGLTLYGGSSAAISKNGVSMAKGSNGYISLTLSTAGNLGITASVSKSSNYYSQILVSGKKVNDGDGTTVINGTSSNNGTTVTNSVSLVAGTYYVYNTSSAASNVSKLIFTPVFTVTFNSNGGSDVASQQITGGQIAAQPEAPTRAGHTFAGWKLNDKNYDFRTPVAEDITLVAQWTEGTAGEVGYVGAFTAEGADKPTESKEGSNYATAYTAEFNVTAEDRAVYTNPEIEWSFDFGESAPTVGKQKRTKSVSTGSLGSDFKYGLVINGVYLLEQDAAVSATLKNGLSEQAGQ